MLPEFLSNEWILIYGGLAFTVLIIFTETAYPIGVVIPGGETLLVVSGLLVGTDWIEVNILLLMIPITLFAFMGDLTGYSRGNKMGQALYEKENGVFFKKKYIKRTEKFNKRYGVVAPLVGRFIPVIKTFNPLVYGAKELSFVRFFIMAGLGCVMYVNSLLLLGFFIGRWFPDLKDHVQFIIAAILVFILITPIITLMRRGKKRKTI